MSIIEIHDLSVEIAKALFTNGNGHVADRLVHMDKDGKEHGGWCQQAVADRIMVMLAKHDGDQQRHLSA